MKFYKLLIMLLALALTAGVSVSRAQIEEPVSNEPEDMDEDTWEAQITEYMAKKAELTAKLGTLQSDIDQLARQNDLKNDELKKAEDNLWAEVGGKDAYIKFKYELEKYEKMCRNKEGSKADIMEKVGEMNNSRARCHPELFSRFNKLKDCLDSWQSSVAEYTVTRGDYLFVIAARPEVYNDRHYWPLIWEANENGVSSAPRGIPKTIRNPHLIYPGQVLKIPKITEASKKSDAFSRALPWIEKNNLKVYRKRR